MLNTRFRLWLAAVGLMAATSAARADTMAYWRHEEGDVGALIPAGENTVLDSSGNDNHMQTFDPSFTSATYSAAVSPLALRSGLPNTRSLDFGPGGDDAGQNDDNYTNGKPVQSQLFEAMTVELAFNMHQIGGYQALVGKDGKPLGGSPVPPLKIMVRGDDFPGAVPNQLFVEWIDGDGDIHFVSGHTTVAANTWNHVAFVLTATDAKLYVAGENSPYTLVDSIAGADFAGAANEVLINDPTSFSVGRGMFNGGVADWSNALIDEVRISNSELGPDGFLFVAVPEPASTLLLLLGACGAVALGGRWAV